MEIAFAASKKRSSLSIEAKRLFSLKKHRWDAGKTLKENQSSQRYWARDSGGDSTRPAPAYNSPNV
jgi:hypothetical protein